MKNVPEACVMVTSVPVIKFEENKRIIRFHNPDRLTYKMVQIDGCAITEGCKCDNMLFSADESAEMYVELKGIDVTHALDSFVLPFRS